MDPPISDGLNQLKSGDAGVYDSSHKKKFIVAKTEVKIGVNCHSSPPGLCRRAQAITQKRNYCNFRQSLLATSLFLAGSFIDILQPSIAT